MKLKDEYTIEEFIKEQKLGVGVRQSGATRLIAQRLRELGYVRKRLRDPKTGKARPYWVRKGRDDKLLNKLGEIK